MLLNVIVGIIQEWNPGQIKEWRIIFTPVQGSIIGSTISATLVQDSMGEAAVVVYRRLGQSGLGCLLSKDIFLLHVDLEPL